jgi:hypothetical protein
LEFKHKNNFIKWGHKMNLEVGVGTKLEGEYLEQTQDVRNEGVLKSWLPYWVMNAFMNHSIIMNEAAQKNVCVSMLQGKGKGKPAVIVGSGPSLDLTAPLLGNWKGAVFACGSNALIPTRWGHQPEYICVFDAGDSLYPKMLGWDWKGSTLLTHPSASPLIIKNWKWDKYYYLMMHYGIQWFEEIQPLAYGDFTRFENEAPPRIKIMVGNAGCTVNNAIQLASFMGFNPLFLIGVDCGYPEGKERCTRWEFIDGEWRDLGPDVYTDRKLHVADNGVLTTEEQIEYKAALLDVWRIDSKARVNSKIHQIKLAHGLNDQEIKDGLSNPQADEELNKTDLRESCVQLFDCSKGIITELPNIEFKEVIEIYESGRESEIRDRYYSIEKIESIVDDYVDKRPDIQIEGNVDRPVTEVLGEIERQLHINSKENIGNTNEGEGLRIVRPE